MSYNQPPYGQPPYYQQAQPPYNQQPQASYIQQPQPPYNQQPQPPYNQQPYTQPPYSQPPSYQQPYPQPPWSQNTQPNANSYSSNPPPAQPSYGQPNVDQKTSIPPSTSPRPTAGPPPAYTSPRLLHIYHEGHSERRASIKDSSKTTLYSIDLHHWSKPHMVVFAGDSKNEIGTVAFHSLSSTMDLTVRGTEFSLKNDKYWTQQYSFVSRATGRKFRWKMESLWTMNDFVCMDEKDMPIAKFEGSTWALRKLGKIELVQGLDGALLDEVLMSGLAMVEMVQRTKKAAVGAAG
ncbi:MAG: hypothetical protein M1812_002850 [Candelaria pacifica]|nr:MAG: hypothetical protein M1812_002850 [Candelaria pacifica]